MWAWGLAALFLSPLIAGVVLALTPDGDDSGGNRSSQSSGKDWENNGHEEKRCPECGYIADAGEAFCPRCGEMLW